MASTIEQAPGEALDSVPLGTADDVHKPYVPDETELTELTPAAIILGILLGLVFAASSVYLALKIGLTVSASIPIAVLSITIFRYISKAFGLAPASILQNNIVQTTGSAGESIAAGVVFTLPGLILLGFALPLSTVAAVSLVGGLLGVLLMIPLRRSLIVQEHRTLKYPEGTACAEVLIAGEEGGTQAKMVFMGFGLGALYKLLNVGAKLWADVPRKAFEILGPGGRRDLVGEMRAEISPELTGVGFIIGPKISGYLFAGGVLAWFVMIPTIKLFGSGLETMILPNDTQLIRDMDAATIRNNYIYYIGAGAVTAAGVISLFRALPTIWSALVSGLRDFSGANAASTRRTQRDLPMGLVAVGSLVLVAAMVLLPQIGINLFGAVLALFFAFLFAIVSSRIAGAIGASANPISGMTVATVLMTSLVFLAVGWTAVEHRVLALTIGGVVCVAAAVAAATSQDLKTGYLVGATPRRQQIGLVFGVVTSALLIGWMITFLNEARTTIVPKSYPGVTVTTFDAGTRAGPDGQQYRVGRIYDQTGAAPTGAYLVRPDGSIAYVVDPGIGGRETRDANGREVEKLDSPKAQIMRFVVDGILGQKLPWGLILIGAFISIAMEILGLPSLPIATGVYLPISTSATMFMGGIVRWLTDRRLKVTDSAETDAGPGVLFSSGLIAGGAIMGVVLAALSVKGWDVPLNMSSSVGALGESPIVAMIVYVLAMSVPLYLIAMRWTRSDRR